MPSGWRTRAGSAYASSALRISLTLADRRKLRHHTEAVRGTGTNPMTRDEVAAKAYDLMYPSLGENGARRVVERVWELERLPSLAALGSLLQGKAKR